MSSLKSGWNYQDICQFTAHLRTAFYQVEIKMHDGLQCIVSVHHLCLLYKDRLLTYPSCCQICFTKACNDALELCSFFFFFPLQSRGPM